MAHVNVNTERNPSTRDDEKRSRPFRAVLLMAWLVLPVFFLLERIAVGAGGDGIKWLIVWLDLLLFGAIMPLVAVGRGLKVGKREPFVVGHVAITIHLFAVAASLAVIPGWNHVAAGERWWNRLGAWLANVFTMPLWIVVVYFIASLAVALSWLIYRIDAFRADPRERDGDGQSGIEKLLKWPVGARIRSETIEADDFAVTAEVDHEGIPIAQLRNALPAAEEHGGIIRGRSSIVGGDRGGRSTIRLVREDPHKSWRPWPGLTHPGGLFHEPISTSYYSTGEKQWYSFVRTPDGYRSRVAPDFASPNGSFKGSQGMTSSGKSGDAAIEIAEILSRSDVVVVYIDTAKLLQNAGWCLDMCALAAGSRAASGALFTGLRRLGEYRARVLGEAGIRDFSHEAFARTGMPWIYIFADEFDVAKQNADMQWLATKARSLGIRFSFTLPRATGDNIDTNIRAAVGMWAQFGISQDYDSGFVISRETLEAGANPEQFGATVPGVHYLDRAPGIDPKMYAIDCRTYKTREDFGDLRRAVEAARATFTPADLTAGELEALGPVATICRPSVVRNGHLGQDDEEPPPPPAAGTPLAAPAAATTREDDDDVRNSLALDPETRAMLDDLPSTDVSDLEREYGDLDPRKPMPATTPDTFKLQPTKPVAGPEETVREFDAALVRMAARGVKQFTPADVRDEMRVSMRGNRMSERFSALAEDATLNPPGLKIERLGGGQYLIVRLQHGR